MRRSIRQMRPVALFALFVLLPAAGAIAENADFTSETTDGSQIVPAGPDAYVPQPGNLYSVPQDNMSSRELPGTASPLVKQILAARPNEDLVICIAGCYSGRNRVVYAQPSTKVMKGSLSSTMAPEDPRKLGLDVSRRAAAVDPSAPSIINRTN